MEAIRVTVAEAEVYRHGCTLVLRGTAEVQEGANHLVVGGLPDGLEHTSIAVRMPPEVMQEQVRVRYADLGVKDQSDELNGLDRRIDEIDRRSENKKVELDSWKKLAAQMSGPSAIDYLDRLPERLEWLTSEISDLARMRLDLTEQRDLLREECLRPRLELDVSSTMAGPAPIEIVCRSTNAGWDPVYDVLVDGFDAPLRLRLKGSVWQKSGLAWEGITLRLSTGTAVVMGDLPRFTSCYLEKDEPMPLPKAGKAMGFTFGDAFAPLATSASADDTLAPGGGFGEMREMSAREAVVEQQATATTYELAGAQSLESTGKEQTFTVTTAELAASYRLYAFPRVNEAAYLVAHLEEEPDQVVLSQPLSVYIEGSYAGTVNIGSSSDDGGYELPLGTDDRVRVRFHEDARRSKKLLGSKKLIEHTSTITVENRKDLPASIVVLERVPVSLDKEIEVTVKETSGATHDADRGELRWERTLEAGGSLKLVAAYEVSHARGIQIAERIEGLPMQW